MEHANCMEINELKTNKKKYGNTILKDGHGKTRSEASANLKITQSYIKTLRKSERKLVY